MLPGFGRQTTTLDCQSARLIRRLLHPRDSIGKKQRLDLHPEPCTGKTGRNRCRTQMLAAELCEREILAPQATAKVLFGPTSFSFLGSRASLLSVIPKAMAARHYRLFVRAYLSLGVLCGTRLPVRLMLIVRMVWGSRNAQPEERQIDRGWS